MFIKQMEISYIIQKKLKGQTQALYMMLSDFCYGHKIKCFPSRETLANKLNCSIRTIDRHKNILEQVGLISKKRRGKMKTNVYILPLKEISNIVDRITNKVNNNKKVTRQKSTGKETKYLNDDYSSVQDIINEAITVYGCDVVGQALDKMKKYTISINGFYTYLIKTINSVKKELEHMTFKKSYKGKGNYKNSKNNNSTFNNYTQREYDFGKLERALLGFENVEYEDTLMK